MPIIIDGNNLLHSLPTREQSRQAVRRRALDTVRHEGVSLTVVFDGPPPAGSPALEHLGRVSVHYSGTASADDVIVETLSKGGPVSKWVVVTDDRGLRDRVRNLGAQVRTLAEWRGRRLQKARRAPHEPKLSSREIEDWQSYFATGDDSDG